MTHITAKILREKKLATIQSEKFDLLVVGGGITGAGVALDAASRGLKTLLVEKSDFASGTSSKSTKLIHGGLRYLKNFEFGLVKEVGHEREIVWRNAPHLVHPDKMLLPLVKGGSLSKLGASVGIYVYDYLAGVKTGERRKMLSAGQTLDAEPSLNKDAVVGGALYTEYRTDDARLTIELVKTAETYGALAINYVKATEPIYENGKIKGFRGQDQLTGEIFDIHAEGVINAAGPWVDEVRKADGSLSGKRLKLSKGIHLVFPFKKLPINHALYFDVKGDQGRMIFVIPRGRAVYAGTTDTFYDDAEKPNVTKEDVAYILDAVNAMFPEAKLSVSDVESTWSGVRPLIMEDGKSASELSRKDELFISESGLVTIAGGKLTGYRKMAERSVDAWLKNHPYAANAKSCSTKNIPLTGGVFKNKNEYLQRILDMCGQIPHTFSQLEELFGKYGSETEKIVEYAYEVYNTDRTEGFPLKKAELLYSIVHEYAVKPSDFYVRRSGMLYFDRTRIEEHRNTFSSYWNELSGFHGFDSELDSDFHHVLDFK